MNLCKLCGSSKVHFLYFVKGYEICKCEACTFVQTNGNFERESIAATYSESYFDRTKYGKVSFDKQREYERRLNFMRRSIPSGKSLPKVLEIGCATGEFINYSLNEFEWWGTDISQYAISVAKANISCIENRFQAGAIEELQYELSFFDAIVLWDVVEHLRSPKDVLERVIQYLKPGGILIISTPDIGSLMARIFGSRWSFMTPQDHLCFFSKSTAKLLFEKTLNFRIIGSRSMGKWTSIGFVAYKLERIFPHLIPAFLKKTVINFFSRVPIYVPTNDILYLVVQKKQ